MHMRLGKPCTNQYLVSFSCFRELLVVTGGYSWNSILARTEALNMTAEEGNRWRRLAPLLKPRYLHACSPIQLGTEVHFGEAQELWEMENLRFFFQDWGAGGRGLLLFLSQFHRSLPVRHPSTSFLGPPTRKSFFVSGLLLTDGKLGVP